MFCKFYSLPLQFHFHFPTFLSSVLADEKKRMKSSQSALWPAMFPGSRTSSGRAPRRAAAYAQGRQRPIY